MTETVNHRNNVDILFNDFKNSAVLLNLSIFNIEFIFYLFSYYIFCFKERTLILKNTVINFF